MKEGTVGNRWRAEWARLVFPDGSSTECRAHDCDSRIEGAFRKTHGAPPVPSQPQQWRYDSGAKVEERRGWIAIAYRPDGEEEQLNIDLSDWRGGVPLRGIAQTMNRFSADGWTVISTFEDKGLYRGADAQDESYPARMRFLLGRVADA